MGDDDETSARGRDRDEVRDAADRPSEAETSRGAAPEGVVAEVTGTEAAPARPDHDAITDQALAGIDLAALDSPALARRLAFESLHERVTERPSHPVALGRFVVLSTLGHGGMGSVFKAYDASLDRAIAIKQLHPTTKERDVERLRREAQALAKLSHPNVVHVYEVGKANGQWFIAMELVPGKTLRQWQADGPDWRACVQMYLGAGAGLAAAHAVGLVHRDFKPDNCIIDDQGRPRVLDFGLARDAGSTEVPSSGAESHSEDASMPLTRTGAVLGTLAYMPIEQLEGKPADARSDQFSFCVALYEALYDERPFGGETTAELAAALASDRVRPAPRGSAVPSAVRRVLLRGLSADPQRRWPSMEALLTELRRHVAPRTGRWIALGLAGGLTAVGVGLASYAEVGFRCEGAAAQLDGVWDPDGREAVGTAILSTGLPYAPDTWARIEPRLDAYADAWVAKHTEVCEATSVRQEQSAEVMDLRMECLRQRRLALRETVQVLVDADATRAEKAVELVAGLPGLARCDDVEALRSALPPPEDPRVAAQVEALRARLVQVRTLSAAGDFEAARTEADAVVAAAEALDHPPLLAEALLQRADNLERLARYPQAERDAERAYELAARLGHDAVLAMAVGLVARVVGPRQGRYEVGRPWAMMALALSRGPGQDPALEAASLDRLGALTRRQGDFEASLDYHQQALARWREHTGPRSTDVAGSLHNLGLTLERQGAFDDALSHHRQALEILREVLGPRHPQVSNVLDSEASVLKAMGRLEDALRQYQLALDINAQAYDAEHPAVAHSVQGIADVLLAQGKSEQSLQHYQRALAIREKVLGPRHAEVAITLQNAGIALHRIGRLDEALDYYQRALEIREQVLGPDNPDVATSLNNIGVLLRTQGKRAEALVQFRRALAISERALGPRHLDIARRVHNIGRILADEGELQAAREHFERSLSIAEEALGPDHPDLGHPLAGLSEVTLGLGDVDAARAYGERAVAIGEAGETSPEVLAKARFELARALWIDPAQRARARTLVEQAREGYASLGEGMELELGRTDAWLAAHPAP